ncbi:MAG: 3-deoxy-7-phosphoheptulonate synthase [Bacteroidota bacterium]|nr:3-deoxy-7-phosphoheptulonate synthase [Bacteroidota bacterium]
MILQLKKNPDEQLTLNIEKYLTATGYSVSHVNTQENNYLIVLGKVKHDIRKIGSLPGVADIHFVDDAYQLVSRMWKTQHTILDLGDNVTIGGNDFCVMSGPCSIESEEQVINIADTLVTLGIRIMRGGVFKPRTSPYAYRGGGIDALKMFHQVCQERQLKIISEVMDASQIDDMLPYVDILQVGTRNAQNFNLLDALGKCDKPVMLKRGMSGTIEELLQAAEYVFSSGNEKIILCERGIRTFENAYRNTLDLNAVAVLKDKSHLPVIADPSHGIGIRKYVGQMALASMLAGADGFIVETHPIPEKAISDGQQTLNFDELSQLMKKVEIVKTLKDRMAT